MAEYDRISRGTDKTATLEIDGRSRRRGKGAIGGKKLGARSCGDGKGNGGERQDKKGRTTRGGLVREGLRQAESIRFHFYLPGELEQNRVYSLAPRMLRLNSPFEFPSQLYILEISAASRS